MPSTRRCELNPKKILVAALLICALGLLGSHALASAIAPTSPGALSAVAASAISTAFPGLEMGPSPSPTASPTTSPTASATIAPTASPIMAFSDGTPPPSSAPVAPPKSAGGRYSFAIPALGLAGPIRNMSQCGGLLADGGIWAWPCGGHDNLVLLAHAWGSFAPIYHGYHSGKLHTGLSATYIGPSGGRGRYYIAAIWNLPVAKALSGWAFVAERSPVITLVTCNDPGDSYRIIVRLIPVGASNPDPTFPPVTSAPTLAPTTAPAPSAPPPASPTPLPVSPTPVSGPSASPPASPAPVSTPTAAPTAAPTPHTDPTPSPIPASKPTPMTEPTTDPTIGP